MPDVSHSPDLAFDEDLMLAGIKKFRAETAKPKPWIADPAGKITRATDTRNPALTSVRLDVPAKSVSPAAPRLAVTPARSPRSPLSALNAQQAQVAGLSYRDAVAAFQKQYLEDALVRSRGNKCAAARAVALHRNTFDRHLAELQIDVRKICASLKKPPQRATHGSHTAERTA